MQQLPNKTRFDGYGSTPGEAGDFATPAEQKAYFEGVIAKANTVPLYKVMVYYNVHINCAHRCTIICPFKHHKGGRERTGSFTFYPETNSFHCHGCKTGGNFAHAVEFVAAMDNTTKAKAAHKIQKIFSEDTFDDVEVIKIEDFSERLEIMLSFSNIVRDFRQSFFDDVAINFIEQACKKYDELNLKHKLSNFALKTVTDNLAEQITNFRKN